MIRERLLVAASDPAFRKEVRTLLGRSFPDFEVLESGPGEECWNAIRQSGARIVYYGHRPSDPVCHELLRRVRQSGVPVLVIILSEGAEIARVVECIKAGAYSYLARPFAPQELLRVSEEAIAFLRENRVLFPAAPPAAESFLTGESPALVQLLELIRQVAPASSTVLITGESGTGKELAAREVHRLSRRADRPMVVVNCAAIPAGLVESELFGHVAGAFTGAGADQAGLLEAADGGTAFLDEIGEFPLDLQVKVLRVLQDGEVRRVGADHSRRLDLRVIAATNRDLEAEVDAGRFRKDLYYRLNVVRVHLPPLRERKQDLELFIAHFLERYRAEYHHRIRGFSRGAVAMLRNYSWPGNVRELEHALMQVMALHGEREVIEENDLPMFLERRGPERQRRFLLDAVEVGLSLDDYAREFVRMFERDRGEGELAETLGITPKTLWEKRRKWGMPRQAAAPRKKRRSVAPLPAPGVDDDVD